MRHRSGAYRLAAAILRPFLRLVSGRVWLGIDNLPRDTGFIVCSNHLCNLDPLTLAHYLNDNGFSPRFMGKQELFEIPLIGRIMYGAGHVPVLRDTPTAAAALGPAIEAVKAGECVVIYPEGTFTFDPDLWPMTGKTGAARLALATGAPVIPVGQWGVHEVNRPFEGRIRFWPRRNVTVMAGPSVDLSAYREAFGLHPTAETLRAVTDTILDDITDLVATLRHETPPAQRWDRRVPRPDHAEQKRETS